MTHSDSTIGLTLPCSQISIFPKLHHHIGRLCTTFTGKTNTLQANCSTKSGIRDFPFATHLIRFHKAITILCSNQKFNPNETSLLYIVNLFLYINLSPPMTSTILSTTHSPNFHPLCLLKDHPMRSCAAPPPPVQFHPPHFFYPADDQLPTCS